jgi:cystathionine beta-lyase
MSNFDFDTLPERRDTASLKWDRYQGRDVIPMWVADMDFVTAPPILEALATRVRHGVFGYTHAPSELGPAVRDMLVREHGWEIDPAWLVWLPSLVVGLNVVCRAFAEPGDDVLTSVPIYPPFLSAPTHSGCRTVRVPLTERAGRWHWDVGALESALSERSKVLLLCNPHNPTGRVFTRDELSEVAEVARSRDLVLVSDEIHCGLVLDEAATHVPLATLGGDVAERTVTLMSASKTFNLPALGCAFAIVQDRALRVRLRRAMEGIVHHAGALGYTATLAAFRDARDWHLALLDYLRENRDLVERSIAEMPGLRTWHAEATYLTWIDARGLGVKDPAKWLEDAGVGLSDGAEFDAPGFVRLNFACPRSLLREALERMRRATTAHGA